jgi:hypothetical protein
MAAGKFSGPSGHGKNRDADLITRLRRLPGAPGPDPGFSSELRTQLVAIAPRLIAAADQHPQLASQHRAPPRRGLAALRRPLLAFAGSAAVLVVLLGLAVQLSGGALPGQSLYGLKRASEDFKLSVAGGSDADRGLKYLRLATSRATESGKLVGSTGTASAHTSSLVASTLGDADSETRDGMKLLDTAAVSNKSASTLAPVPPWTSAQKVKITGLLAHLPAGTARNQAASSLALLQRVSARVSQLQADLHCSCLSTANADDLGPKPCTSCVPGAGLPGASSVPTVPGSSPAWSTGGGKVSTPAGSSAPDGSGRVTSTSSSGAGAGGGKSSGGVGLPTVTAVPSVPGTGQSTQLPGVSVSVGSGGIGISVTPTLPSLP